MKSLKFGNVVLCDVVAPGHAGKFNLVNAISGDVIVGVLPANVRFGLYMEVELPSDENAKLNLEVIFDGEIIVGGMAELVEGQRKGVVAIPMFPIKVEKDGILEAFVSAPGYKRSRALRRKIFKGDLPPSVS